MSNKVLILIVGLIFTIGITFSVASYYYMHKVAHHYMDKDTCCTQDCCPLDCKDSETCAAYCCDGVSKHDCKSPCCNGEGK